MKVRERTSAPAERKAGFSATIDRAIYSVFPGWGASRIAARKMFENAERLAANLEERKRRRAEEPDQRFGAVYEGADKDRSRGENWLTSAVSPDTALFSDLGELRLRSRNLFRDDCYFSGAIASRVDNIVGRGIRPEPRVKAEEGFLTAEQAARINLQLKLLYKRIRKTIGYDNQADWQLQRLVQRQWDMDGECFVVFSDVGDPNKPIPLTVEVVDASRCETPPSKASDKNVRLGVERSGGRIVAYWFRTEVPEDQWNSELAFQRIPAERVCHLFEKLFPDQSRGVPWPFACLSKLKDCKDLAEAELIAAETQACWAAFVKTAGNPVDMAEGRSSGARSGQRLENVEPGTIEYLGDGQDIVFSNPSRPGGTFAPFMEANLRAIAAGLNFPFEILAKNYSLTNYSASRMSIIEGRIAFRCRQQFLIDLVLQRIWERIVAEAVVLNKVDIDPTAFAEYPDLYTECSWIPPGWPWIDPTKDVKAATDAVANNFSTKADELAATGKDLEDVSIQRELEVKDELKRGIIPLWMAQVMQIMANAVAGGGENKPKAAQDDPDHDPADEDEPAPSNAPANPGAKA